MLKENKMAQIVDLDTVTVTQPEPVKRTRTVLGEYAKEIGRYAYSVLRSAADEERDLLEEWKDLAVFLALYDLQIKVKFTPEKGKDRVVRYVFFVSNGKPREMSSIRLPLDLAKPFFSLPDKYRLLLSRTFEENKDDLGAGAPFTREQFSDEKTRAEALVLVEQLRGRL